MIHKITWLYIRITLVIHQNFGMLPPLTPKPASRIKLNNTLVKTNMEPANTLLERRNIYRPLILVASETNGGYPKWWPLESFLFFFRLQVKRHHFGYVEFSGVYQRTKNSLSFEIQPHRIHVWYIYLHENHKNEPNVGKYTIDGSYGNKHNSWVTCGFR